jgi:hypothetical protein
MRRSLAPFYSFPGELPSSLNCAEISLQERRVRKKKPLAPDDRSQWRLSAMKISSREGSRADFKLERQLQTPLNGAWRAEGKHSRAGSDSIRTGRLHGAVDRTGATI